MFVELIDQLRCPALHADSWLVLFADESRDRHILRGTLGCPVCGARFPIHGGTVWLRTAAGGQGSGGWESAPDDGSARSPTPAPMVASPGAPAPVPLPPTALAAFLDLAEPGGIVALFGEWAHAAEGIADLVERIEFVAISPESPTHPMQSAIMPSSRSHVPLATGSLRAAAVDRSDDAGMVAAEAARLVRSGGRVLAPSSAPVPHGVRELTRDASWWIGERESGTISRIVPLGVRRPPGA